MKFKTALLFLFFCAELCAYTPENVFVIANSTSKKSMELAETYCRKRNIPSENIIALNLKEAPDITRELYERQIAIPVYEALKKSGKISALNGTNIPKEALVTQSQVEAMTICKGVPFIIRPEIAEMKGEKKNYIKNDAASVDSELAMLLQGSYQLNGFRKNPAAGMELSMDMAKILKLIPIGRLDGHTYEAAKSVLESALEAEKKGLRGRAYIDKSKKYKEGDLRLDKTAEELKAQGFDISIDGNLACMSYTQRFDAPIFYFGWYTFAPIAYFKSKDMLFASGASAQHIYSWSATNLTNTKATWTPNLVSHRAAVSFGYVYEPFLPLTHNSAIYVKSLFQGNCAGIAILASQMGLSWQNIAIADPLFEPLKHDLDAQLSDIESGLGDELSQYAAIRKMNLLAEASGKQKAVEFGKTLSEKLPSKFALNWKISQFLSDLNELDKAIEFAKKSLLETPRVFQNYGLIFEICAFLEAKDKNFDSASIYEEMLDSAFKDKNDDFLKVALPYALKRAKFAAKKREKYEGKLNELIPPKPAKK